MTNKLYNTKIVVQYSISSIISFITQNIHRKLFILIDKNVYIHYVTLFTPLIKTQPYLLVSKGELNKNFFFILKILIKMIHYNLTKNSYFISIGGGVTGDISGLSASIFLRGIPLIHIPTTLLSQVDSSIGGKTGVNTTVGKNLIGTIYHPLYILIATQFLNSIPPSNLCLEFSEVVKIMLINNPNLYHNLYNQPLGLSHKTLQQIITQSIHSKIKILNKDLHDKNYRLKLNLGHTFAHAIESSMYYTVPHSLSVFLGLYIISIFSFIHQRTTLSDLTRIITLLKSYIPFILPKTLTNILSIKLFLISDKKIFQSYIKIITIKKLGKVLIKTIKFSTLLKFVTFLLLTN